MKSLARQHTPLVRYDNDLEKSPLVVAEEVKELTERQATKSPFEVGNLSLLSKKILNLEDELDSYELDGNKLDKIQSGADPRYYVDDNLYLENAKKHDYPLVRNFRSAYRRQVSNITKMPLKYQSSSRSETPVQQVSAQVVALSNKYDDLTPEDKNLARQMDGKPKFVEMYPFPGENERFKFEKLPYGVSLNKIILNVINGQPGMNRKPRFSNWITEMMMTKQCRTIFLDLFWWILISQYKDQQKILLKHFEDKISDNYRQFLENVVPFGRYRDPFFNSFASMVAQGVYASFCYVFPDSYGKYGENFKEKLLEVCGQWLQGTKLRSGSWVNWNYDSLEPPGLRLRMEAAAAAAQEDSNAKRKSNDLFH